MWKCLRQVLSKRKCNTVLRDHLTPDRFNEFFVNGSERFGEKFGNAMHEWKLPSSMYTFKYNPVESKEKFLNTLNNYPVNQTSMYSA